MIAFFNKKGLKMNNLPQISGSQSSSSSSQISNHSLALPAPQAAVGVSSKLSRKKTRVENKNSKVNSDLISSLSLDLQKQTLSYLTFTDHFNVMLVSKEMRNMNNRFQNTNQCLHIFGLLFRKEGVKRNEDFEGVEDAMQKGIFWFPQILTRGMEINWWNQIREINIDASHESTFLPTISIADQPDKSENAMVVLGRFIERNAKTLRSLNWLGRELSENVGNALSKCSQLKSIDFSQLKNPHRFYDLIIKGKKLERVTLDPNCSSQNLDLLSKECPDVKEAIFERTVNISTQSFIDFAKRVKNLRLLELRGINITSEILAAFKEHCPQLESMKLIYCNATQMELLAHLPSSLKSLELYYIKYFNGPHDILTHFPKMENLRKLNLFSNIGELKGKGFSVVFKNAPNIRELQILPSNLWHENELANAFVSLQILECLKIQNAGRISNITLDQVGKSFPRLKVLSLEFEDLVITKKDIERLGKACVDLEVLEFKSSILKSEIKTTDNFEISKKTLAPFFPKLKNCSF